MAWGLLAFFILFTTSFLHASALRPAPAPGPWPAFSSPAPAPVSPLPVIKAGYWPAGRNGTFPSASIDFTYFTHILYAFVQPDPSTFQLAITDDEASAIANFTATVHRHRPHVGALLSIGGGGSSSTLFANIVSTRVNRLSFISSTIAVARWFDLDGLDLDWEFPANPKQMTNLGHLYTEWRDAADQDAAVTGRRRLLLTSAVYFASHFFLSGMPRSYPGAAMAGALDWVNAMCFDYHGGWNTSETGAQAALYDGRSNVSTSYGLRSWLAAGLPAEKVVMGLPLYGRTWRLRDAAEHGIGAPAVGVGPGASDGTMVYSAVVEYNAVNKATVVEDAAAGAVYSYAGTSWIGYDDPTTVGWKVEFARELGLGGHFLWALGYDYDWTISRRASVTWES